MPSQSPKASRVSSASSAHEPRAYDVVIVGGAAAGLTAAMYTARRALKTMVISTDIGGQASLTSEIENYPGRDLTDGFELMSDFKNQAERFGAEVVIDQAIKITVESETSFLIQTHQETYRAKAVILAFGLTPKSLGVSGEDKFKGRGVSTCATCDGPLYKNKTVVVTGVGDPALDAVQYLCKLNARVTYVCPRPVLVGSKHMQDAVKCLENVTTYLNATVTEILGDKTVTAVKAQVNGESTTMACDGVFVEMGYIANAAWVKDVVKLDASNHIVIDEKMATSCAGIFAAGDITTISHKQVVISAGEGAKAALSLYKYLQENGKVARGVPTDWGIVKSTS